MQRKTIALTVFAVFLLLALQPVIAIIAQDVPFGAAPTRLVPEIISAREHDSSAFTQGLLLHDDFLYESTGLYGESTLRKVDPETGEVLRSVDINAEFFAEGLELVGDRLIQLTWREETAFVYDANTFEQINLFQYEGEGWGLCSNGKYLYMSDGSPFISIRDIDTFELIAKMLVTSGGVPISLALWQDIQFINDGRINELECVGDHIYANLWQTDFIIKIDPTDGHVVSIIDASGLLTEEEQATADVLNGIAYNPESDTFLITGKLWPKMFEVRFVETNG